MLSIKVFASSGSAPNFCSSRAVLNWTKISTACPAFSCLLFNFLGQFKAIHRLDQRTDLDRVLGFVRLQMAYDMAFNLRIFCQQRRKFTFSFLHTVFRNMPDAGIDGFLDHFQGTCLVTPTNNDIFGITVTLDGRFLQYLKKLYGHWLGS